MQREYDPPSIIGQWVHVNECRPPEGVTVLGCWGKVADDLKWDIEACVYEDEEWIVRGNDGVAQPDFWIPLEGCYD